MSKIIKSAIKNYSYANNIIHFSVKKNIFFKLSNIYPNSNEKHKLYMILKWTLKLPLFWEIKMSKFIRSYLNKRFWICRMKNRKILLPFVTDEQKLLEEVRHSGVTGSPYFFFKKNLEVSRQSWSTDKSASGKVQQDFGKCPTHAWRVQTLNKTSYKFEMVTVVSRT